MMFRFKKKEMVKDLKFTPLYIRISSLFNSVDNNKCDIYSSDKTESFEVETFYMQNNKYFRFTFKSNNGPVEVNIANSTNQEYKPYKVVYINKSTKWMFEINVFPDYTSVQPALGREVTAEDIDLALLEIETFVDAIVQENKTNFAIHLKELKKLENLDFKQKS